MRPVTFLPTVGMVALLAAMPVRAEDAPMTFAADGLTRQQALAQLLSGTSIKIEFANRALAKAKMRGSLTAKRDVIAAWLLSGTSYSIIYQSATEQILRIVVIHAGTGATSIHGTPDATPTRHAEESITHRHAALFRTKLARMQTANEALRSRLAELPPGRHIIRTQAVRSESGAPAGQRGNVPIFIGIPLYP